MSEMAVESVIPTGYAALGTVDDGTVPLGPVHAEMTRLDGALREMNEAVSIHAARLIHVFSPEDANKALIGRIRDDKPRSPLAERVGAAADEVERLLQWVAAMTAMLEI